jgi:hypothetical protein
MARKKKKQNKTKQNKTKNKIIKQKTPQNNHQEDAGMIKGTAICRISSLSIARPAFPPPFWGRST